MDAVVRAACQGTNSPLFLIKRVHFKTSNIYGGLDVRVDMSWPSGNVGGCAVGAGAPVGSPAGTPEAFG